MKNFYRNLNRWLALLTLILPLVITNQTAIAQFSNTPEGRLALLCKTWGMLKYHHTEVKIMNVNWDSVLLAHVLAVKTAATLNDFNIEMNNLVDAAGIMQSSSSTAVPNMPVNVDFSWINDPMFDSTLVSKLQFVQNNFVADSNLWVSYGPSGLEFPYDDDPYPNIVYPPVETRLLYMFKFWNMVNYYFPYKPDMDFSWDQTLVDYIPSFDTASSALSYHLGYTLLCKRLSDTHAAYTRSDVLYGHWKFDQPTPPVYLRLLNNQTVVTRLFAAAPGLNEGDIIHKINGMDIDSLRMEYRKYFSSATEAVGNQNALMDMMQTYGNPSIQFEAEDSTGNISLVSVNSTMSLNDFLDSVYACSWCGPAYQITECGYGYVNMGKLQVSQVNAMYNALHNAPAIIFDLRNYPNGTAWDIAEKLFSNNTPFARLHWAAPEFPGDYYMYMDNIGNSNNWIPYSGKIYILVNEITQSQAEYSAMMLSACPSASLVKTIGSTTSGADGNVVQFYFPGFIRLTFTGLGVFYPDSTVTQRVGVQIDSVVVPTPHGIRNGIDELLLAAFDCLTGIEQHEQVSNNFDVYPNPSAGILNFHFDTQPEINTIISIYDVRGQIVFEKNLFSVTDAMIELPETANGLFMVKVTSGKTTSNKKITIQR